MLLYHRPSKAFYNLTISQIPAPAQVFACAILAEHLNMEDAKWPTGILFILVQRRTHTSRR